MRLRILSLMIFVMTAMSITAQDIHFTQFSASPLTINPALTGNFHGLWRVNTIYRSQWSNINNAFETVGASFDAPIVSDLTHDDYLAGGIELYNDRSGDGVLTNFSGLASLAYHKMLGKSGNNVLSVGLQGGYSSKALDLFSIYWSDEFRGNGFDIGSSGRVFDNKLHYFTVNVGAVYSARLGRNSGLQVGLGANNLNSPINNFAATPTSETGLPRRYTGQLGMIFRVGRLDIKPGFLAQYQANAQELIGGAEFNVRIGGDIDVPSVATSVFLASYYRYEDAIMASAGIQTNGFRIGVGYDYNVSELGKATNGTDAWEIALTYIAPDPMDFAKRIVFPCQRF